MRIRLTLWNGVIVAVLMIACGLVLCLRVQDELSRSIDARLAAMADPMRVPPPFFPPPPPGKGGLRATGPLPGPGLGFGIVSEKGLPGVPAGVKFTAGPVTAFGGSPPVAAFGAVRGSSEASEQGGVLFDHTALAEDGLTPLPRFFALTEGAESIGLPDGKPWAWDPVARTAAAGGREQYTTITRAGTRMRVLTVPMRRRGKVIGVVQVAHSLTDQDRLIALQMSTLSIFVPLSVLISALAGTLLTGHALRPVRRLTQAANEIEARDLSRRLEVRGNAEFAELCRTFNPMTGRRGDAFEELQRGYHRIEKAYGRLEVAYEHQRRFTSDASHELRTPLARIKACASLALSANRPAASYRASLELIERCTDGMARLVDDLLLLARGDAAQIRLKIETLPGDEVAQEAIHRLGASGTRIRVSAPLRVEVPADREYLIRVLLNLLENADRHTPPDGSVLLFVRREGPDAVFSVEDTGEGIPAEHLPHVRERFYRVDAGRDRTRGGTGLGLAICQSIVAAHAGRLEIESEVGRGTRVTVRLPGAGSQRMKDEG